MPDEDVLMLLKMYYPDQVPEDADSLEGIDEELVSYIREALASETKNSEFSNWMNAYREKIGVETTEMPEGLPYDIDLTPYQGAVDADGDVVDDAEDGQIVELAEEVDDSAESGEASGSSDAK